MTELEKRLENEKAITIKLVDVLKAAGFNLVAVNDGEDYVYADSGSAAYLAASAVDEATLLFKKDNVRRVVALVFGNDDGCDLIADCSCPEDDKDPFLVAIDEVADYCEELRELSDPLLNQSN